MVCFMLYRTVKNFGSRLKKKMYTYLVGKKNARIKSRANLKQIWRSSGHRNNSKIVRFRCVKVLCSTTTHYERVIITIALIVHCGKRFQESLKFFFTTRIKMYNIMYTCFSDLHSWECTHKTFKKKFTKVRCRYETFRTVEDLFDQPKV